MLLPDGDALLYGCNDQRRAGTAGAENRGHAARGDLFDASLDGIAFGGV